MDDTARRRRLVPVAGHEAGVGYVVQVQLLDQIDLTMEVEHWAR